MSASGFRNEHQIASELNNKSFNSLSKNFKSFILHLLPTIDQHVKINASVIGGSCKPDLKVTINNKDYFISIKVGSGNSVHQEPLDDFLVYISKNCTGSNKSINDFIAHFIWGDGTLIGNGPASSRLRASEYKKLYHNKLVKLNLFFSKNKITILSRALKNGSSGNIPADFLYYGDKNSGIICNMDKAIKYLSSSSCNSAINLGGLSIQAWNRNLNGGTKSEKKRGVIQLKWGSLAKDIPQI